jgi:hypothetical protein
MVAASHPMAGGLWGKGLEEAVHLFGTWWGRMMAFRDSELDGVFFVCCPAILGAQLGSSESGAPITWNQGSPMWHWVTSQSAQQWIARNSSRSPMLQI